MKIRYILSLLTVAFLLGSCATPKVAYFTDLKRGTAEQVLNPLEIRIRPEDKISIQVNSKDPLLMNLFNLPIISRQIGTTSGTSNSQGISGYTINKDGDIDFPVLGHIHVAGMTRAEIASYIKEELVSKNLVKDPVVTVEFMNLTVSVLGEVATPGRFNIEKDKLTLLEALSMAGDLTVYGKRENVLVQREENGKKTLYQVNLNSGYDLYASPVYYLQQNDIVYVEPNSMKARQATVNGNNVRSASFWMSLASLLTTITVLIVNNIESDMMTVNQKNIKPGQQDDFLRIQDLLYLCLARWKWFVLSLAVTIGAATAYLLRTPAVYTRTASVLIKEDSKGKSVSSDLESFSEFGLFQSGTNVNNELITFRSPSLMTEVVKRLRLDMNYFVRGKFHRQVAYGLTLPVDVTINDLPENESAGFTLEIQPDGTLYLSDFIRNGTDLEEKDVKGSLLDSITTPLGKIIIHTTPNYVKGEAYTLYVGKSSLYNAVNSCSSNLSVSLNSEKASVIDLSFKDNSTQRAEDVLSMLISVYNENWVKDKNQIAVSTSMFINERLGVIERELGNVDEDISSYKSEHLLPDVQAASSMYMAQSSAANAQILSLNNQLYMTRYIRNYLANDANRTQLLPANSGIESANIESQIAEYNKQLLQRNSLVANSSTENPLVVDMDQALASMRGAIIRSIDNQIVTLNSQIKSLRQTEQQTTSRIAANPTQAKYLLSVERQQKVKEALYLFLLQKREENELSQAFTAYNTRIVTPPHGSMLPTSPVHKNIFMVAFALGLLIPIVIIFMRENMNTRVRGRKDLENLTIPFIGEIPLFTRKKKGILGKKPQEVKAVIVKEGNRDIINEAFRVLRTNLEFMTGKDKTSNVIIMTSFNPGSGKSFLTMNIAVSLAIKGKKCW